MTRSSDLIDEVHLLRRELEKLELENRLAQLKAEPIIDEGCVGCCNVVDVAAKLQEELEDTEIKLVGCRNLIDDRDRTIRELSAMVETKTKANQTIIHDKNTIIEELKDRNAEDLYELYDIDKEEIGRLRAKLSACKEDSAVLMEVVEIANKWDNLSVVDRYSASTTIAMRLVYNVVKDYTDAPEEPPETPVDEPQEITVTFAFLELP